MKLSKKDWKEYKTLSKKTNLTKEEQARLKELEELKAKKEDNTNTNANSVIGNDFSWWNKYPEIMADVSNYKCNWLAGTALLDNATPDGLRIPGAARVSFHNMYGFDVNATDPFNMEIRKLYLRMFNKYRGISTYNASDIGITLIATVEIFCVVVKLSRIYGIVKLYDIMNRNLPTVVCSALGLSLTQADYIRSHLSDFRANLNVLIQKAQNICVPNDMSILADKLSLLGNVYLDHNSKRAQMIVFDIDEYGIFEDTKLQSGGCIEFQPKAITEVIDFTYNTGVATAGTTMFPLLDQMLNAVLGNEVTNKQFGDMTGVFGLDKLVTMSTIAEDYTVVPAYSESILHKLHNADFLQTSAFAEAGENSFHKLKIAYPTGMSSQDRNTLSATPNRFVLQFSNVMYTKVGIESLEDDASVHAIGGLMFPSSNMISRVYRTANPISILDSYHSDFTPEIVTEGCLWKFCPVRLFGEETVVEDETVVAVNSCGPEILDKMVIYTGKNTSVSATSLVGNRIDGGGADPIANILEYLEFTAYFDWAPMLYKIEADESSAKISQVFGDLDNARPMYITDIMNLHRAVVQSGFRTDIQPYSK